jgi:hypothetical protein
LADIVVIQKKQQARKDHDAYGSHRGSQGICR